jgi:quercetin dioxygenase-like cupin family protein
VLEGVLKLELEGSEPVVLKRGDSAYYASDRPHRWSNAGKGIVRVVSAPARPTGDARYGVTTTLPRGWRSSR